MTTVNPSFCLWPACMTSLLMQCSNTAAPTCMRCRAHLSIRFFRGTLGYIARFTPRFKSKDRNFGSLGRAFEIHVPNMNREHPLDLPGHHPSGTSEGRRCERLELHTFGQLGDTAAPKLKITISFTHATLPTSHASYHMSLDITDKLILLSRPRAICCPCLIAQTEPSIPFPAVRAPLHHCFVSFYTT